MRLSEKIWKTVGIFLIVVIMGVLFLAMAYVIPVNEKNKAASYEILKKEGGGYPMIPIVSASFSEYFHSFNPGVIDDNADGIMIRNSLETREENVLVAAMDMNEYSRYWHGYVSVLRPLLAICDYGDIRTGNAMLQLLIIVVLCSLMYQKKGKEYALLIFTSYCFLMPLAMPFSLVCSFVFYITYGFLLYLVSKKEGKMPESMKLYWIFMVVGMLTSYFDFLTYPIFTWGVPMVWWLLLQEDDRNQSDYFKNVIYTGLWWLLGYAGMWAMKWCLGSAILGSNIFEIAFGKARDWSGADKGIAVFDRLEALYRNWKHYGYKIYVILLAGWLLFFVVRSMRNGMLNHAKNKALLLVAASSGMWYFVVTEHTKTHHFFTHRIWGISILAICALLLLSTEEVKIQKKADTIKTLLVWGGCGILAIGLSFLPKEGIFVTNGWAEYTETLVKEGQVCEMSFTPSFPTIDGFTLCARTDSRQGSWKIIIADGEEKLYEESIPLEKYQDSTAADIPVLWKLKKEKTYSMRISLEGADRDAYLLVTANHNMPLSEYDEVKVGGQSENGQILAILNYRYRVLSKMTLCAIWIGWMGVLAGIWMAFLPCRVQVSKGDGL